MARHMALEEQLACAEALRASGRVLYRCKTREALRDAAAEEVAAALRRHAARERIAMDFV